MLDDENILSFINRVRQLSSSLKSINVTVEDKEVAMEVLNGLPDRFESLISAMDALGNEYKTFTLDLVKRRLLQEEQRINMGTESVIVKSEAAALFSRSQTAN